MNAKMNTAFRALLHLDGEDLDTMTPCEYESFLGFCRLCTPKSREIVAQMGEAGRAQRADSQQEMCKACHGTGKLQLYGPHGSIKYQYECALCVGAEASKPRFEKTYCSSCGCEFGPGEHGYSHCSDHTDTGAPRNG